MRNLKILIVRFVARMGHKAENWAHMAYLSAVGIEGHGKYKYAAIVLLIVVVLNAIVHIEDE